MNLQDVDFGNSKLLSAELPPSRYLFEREGAARIVSWQLSLADNNVRDILFPEEEGNGNISGVGSQILFNLKPLPIVGAEMGPLEDLRFTVSSVDEPTITFSSADCDVLPIQPSVRYKLYDLHCRVEISVANTGTMPLYWKPGMRFFINLPWLRNAPLAKHVIKSFAKKRLRLADDFTVINSVKSSEKLSLEVLDEGMLGLCQLQDNKIWIGTSNEEEGLSFIFGNKSPQSTFVINKTGVENKLEIVFLSDVTSVRHQDVSNEDMQHYRRILPKTTDIFSVEVSAC